MAKFALLIGVGNYEHSDLKPLVCPRKDVAAMQRILENPEMGDFTEVIPLIDPDPMQMQEAIETLYRDRAKDDLVVLFFSGHGIKDDSGKLYFATRLTRKTPRGELIRSTAVPARFVREIMDNSRWRRQVLILDSCFSGAFDQALNAKDDGSVDVRGQLGAEGRVVLTSSSSTQYSFEQPGSELSIYTRFLVEGIETGVADRDNDGKISVQELHDYATKKVQETAPGMNPKIIVLKDEGYEVVFAKAHITDPKLKYRREVESYSSRGEIYSAGRTALNKVQVQFGLTLEEAKEIENQVLQPYRDREKHLEEYCSAFVKEVERQYPLAQPALDEFKGLQKTLGLRKEDAIQIEEKVTTAYQQRLKRYEEKFTKEIEAKFPLSQPISEELDKYQADLGLSDKNVEPIKQRIIQRKKRQEAERLQQKKAQHLKEQPKQQKEKLERQPAELGKRQDVKQQKKSPQTKEHIRSSSSNKLRVARACLLSIFIAGELFFNSTHPQPQWSVQQSTSTSPTPPTQSSPPTQSVLVKAKKEAKYGNLGEAIETAKSASGAEASEAQLLISEWQPEWDKQQSTFNEVKVLYDSKDWKKVLVLGFDYSSIPEGNKYWEDRGLNKMVDNAQDAIFNEVKVAYESRDWKKVLDLELNYSSIIPAKLYKNNRRELNYMVDKARDVISNEVEPEINQSSESERPSPKQFIKDYYEQTRNNRAITWELLTEDFQKEMSNGKFSEYEKFFLKRQCEVLQVETEEATQESAKVTGFLVYYDDRKVLNKSKKQQWHLVWNSSRNTWQIDIPPPQNNRMGGG
jgi:hypothetical protein